ncbi:MAG: hypothetical protein KGS00_05720 [Alphaproteobacteria bacterium]|nr:hypothetical protein [Alphaproteobacteria bacterium]
MMWLMIEIWILLCLAVALGALLGWFLAKGGIAIRPWAPVRTGETLRLPVFQSEPEPLRLASTTEVRDRSAEQVEAGSAADDGEALRLRLRAAYAEARIRILEGMLRDTIAKPSTSSSTPENGEAGASMIRHPGLSLPAPRAEGPDPLQRLSGLGPSIERRLHDVGIFHFDQLARMSEEDAKWLDAQLGGAGRVRFENWIAEAGRLSVERAAQGSAELDRAPCFCDALATRSKPT